MPDRLRAFWLFGCYLFKSLRRFQAENFFLPHQLDIALRRASPRRDCARWTGFCRFA
jgi:hypothetical protein